VAIATRLPVRDVVSNFGDGPVAPGGASDDEPGREARMVAATCGDIRVVSLYAPNGRFVGSPFYEAKLGWFERLADWLADTCQPTQPLVLGGDMNLAPTDLDVWDAAAAHGGTHVSEPERERFARLIDWGLVDAYRLHHPEGGRFTWWDYRAGHFHKGYGMRIDHLLLTQPLAARCVAAEIDRNARKGKLPSDHAPLYIDLEP
jgi:exodeoxyribonuclease-3